MVIFNQPEKKDFDLSMLKAKDIEFYCTTDFLDRIICERNSIQWSQDVVARDNKITRFYFIAKKNKQYCVVPGEVFEPIMRILNITQRKASNKAKECIEHYIQPLL